MMSYEVVEALKPEIAEELGLSPEVKIIAGAGVMRRQPSAPVRSVRGDATCRLERAARSLSPVKSLVWTHTMPCIPLITRMAVII